MLPRPRVVARLLREVRMIEEPTIEYAEAMNIVNTIAAEVLRRGKAAVIAVADPHGELIALARLDGAPFSSITIAINKAYTAARERKPTRKIGEAARDP